MDEYRCVEPEGGGNATRPENKLEAGDLPPRAPTAVSQGCGEVASVYLPCADNGRTLLHLSLAVIVAHLHCTYHDTPVIDIVMCVIVQ